MKTDHLAAAGHILIDMDAFIQHDDPETNELKKLVLNQELIALMLLTLKLLKEHSIPAEQLVFGVLIPEEDWKTQIYKKKIFESIPEKVTHQNISIQNEQKEPHPSLHSNYYTLQLEKLLKLLKARGLEQCISKKFFLPCQADAHNQVLFNLELITQHFKSMQKEQTLVVSKNKLLLESAKKAGFSVVPYFAGGEIDAKQLQDFIADLKQYPNLNCKVFVDIDDSLVLRAPSVFFKTTVINPHLLSCLKKIKEINSNATFQILSARTSYFQKMQEIIDRDRILRTEATGMLTLQKTMPLSKGQCDDEFKKKFITEAEKISPGFEKLAQRFIDTQCPFEEDEEEYYIAPLRDALAALAKEHKKKELQLEHEKELHNAFESNPLSEKSILASISGVSIKVNENSYTMDKKLKSSVISDQINQNSSKELFAIFDDNKKELDGVENLKRSLVNSTKDSLIHAIRVYRDGNFSIDAIQIFEGFLEKIAKAFIPENKTSSHQKTDATIPKNQCIPS